MRIMYKTIREMLPKIKHGLKLNKNHQEVVAA